MGEKYGSSNTGGQVPPANRSVSLQPVLGGREQVAVQLGAFEMEEKAQRLRQPQANPPATRAPGNAASSKNQVAPSPRPGGSNIIVDMTALMKAGSRIPRPGAAPDVKPNLNWRISDPKRVRTTLGGLMQSIRDLPPPRAARYLTQAEEQETAPAAYSETTTGPVAEHEAIISVIENRRLSGQRQYLDRGQEATVHNIIHAHTRRGMHQFQGIDNKAYRGFGTRHDQGAQNARTAAANIAAHGPTNHATAFIVTGDEPDHPGKPLKPTQQQEQQLGHVRRVGQVGHVFLYEQIPAQPQNQRHGMPGHHHPAAHPSAPQRTR